jgi:hypothetical protein
MKGENKSHLCPLCGGRRKPGTDTAGADVRDRLSTLRKPPMGMADSFAAESSDDKTADDLAALLLKDRKKRLLNANE